MLLCAMERGNEQSGCRRKQEGGEEGPHRGCIVKRERLGLWQHDPGVAGCEESQMKGKGRPEGGVGFPIVVVVWRKKRRL